MKNIVRATTLGLLTVPLLLASCKKAGDDNTLEGPVPTADFAATVDASQFPVRVSFKNNSQDGFIYQWNFGDNSALGSGTDVTHTYQRPGTYQVLLTAAGRGGTSPGRQKAVVIPSACDNAGFSFLTACGGSGAASWTISDQPGAIIRYASNGTTVLSSLPATGTQLPACLLDDQFTFGSNYAYGYDAGGAAGQTYANGTCGPAKPGSSSFIYKPVAGTLGQIILTTNKSFIGLTDTVVNKTYEILEATATRLRLRGTSPDGTKTVVTYMPQISAVDRVKQFLTGGSTRTWKLDNSVAATIVVGPSDADPTGYYAGGLAGSLPACQADDEFTFTSTNSYQYNAMAETFVAGGGGCQAARSVTTPFTFGAATGAGLAQFELAPATPAPFIGVTDAPDRVYRILSIDNQHMVLRAGSSTAPLVFTMKLVVK
ncbi:PKD domain-containing protein [Hymenobacter daeguensis]